MMANSRSDGGGGNRTRVRGRTGQSVYKLRLLFGFARRPVGSRPTAGLAILWCRASGDWLSLGAEPVSDAATRATGRARSDALRYGLGSESECVIVIRTYVAPGCFRRPTGNLRLQLSRRTDHVETRSPPYVCPYCSCMLEISPCAPADKELSLGIYNAVWPHDAITMDEVRVRGRPDRPRRLPCARRRRAAGSGYGAVGSWRPDVVFLLLTVLPDKRRRGAGTGLYEAVSDWARERGLETLEAVVSDDDPESLAFAERRGFVEHRREKGVVLDLAGADPPPTQPPAGVEIVTWAERPELDRGMYEVALEAYPDIPGGEDEEVEPFEEWLTNHMQGSGTCPRQRSSPSQATRSSATPSFRSPPRGRRSRATT